MAIGKVKGCCNLRETVCYISIGSNQGDGRQNCRNALTLLDKVPGVNVLTISPCYRTEPVGITEQDWFINAVVELKTSLSARALLREMLNIENIMGRIRELKGGPRIIDLDILLYGQEVIAEDDLIVPHPEMHNRRFVLEPLNQIASFAIHPAFGISIRGLLERLSDNRIVEKIT
ncbi:MAG TPA: 2-amino-4-hydroxy-6-hydroxymethyldihydropteridine diphosphokinase [Smithellaceae bacterium]|nr:2-amino-4-hydroxy-6-hydroxymethyldihydropteridine diphosphokinase [Smithellaceae bacterium]